MYDSPDITMVEVVVEEGSGIHTEVYEEFCMRRLQLGRR